MLQLLQLPYRIFAKQLFYFRYDEEKGRVDYDYPRNMAMWKGVGNNIDSVFQWKDGKNTVKTIYHLDSDN